MKNIFNFIILFIMGLQGCSYMVSNEYAPKNLYFCVVFEHYGTQLIMANKIESLSEIEQYKKKLQRDFPSFDALYYQVLPERKKLKIKGYSLIDNRLKTIMETDAQHRLIRYIGLQNGKKKECTYDYKVNQITMTCDDDRKQVVKLPHNKSKPTVVYKYYKNKLTNIEKHYTDIIEVYDTRNHLLRTIEPISPYDTCVPYQMAER